MFLAGAIVTLAAVFAQLELFRDLCSDLAWAGFISAPLSSGLRGFASILWWVLLVHGVVSVVEIVGTQTQPPPKGTADDQKRERRTFSPLASIRGAALGESRPSWPML